MIYEYKTAKGEDRMWVLDAFLFSGLRRLSYRTPMRNAALSAARVERGKYKCAKCKNIFNKKQVAIDHINTVIPVTGFTTWEEYINRLFCEDIKLQVLCNNGKNSCHKLKTKLENKNRDRYKNSGVIYKITNKINGMSYIGQTSNIKNPEKRINVHFKKSYNDISYINRAIKHHGAENFTVELLVTCFDIDELNTQEIEFIKKYNTLSPNGYNLKEGGDGGGKCSEEVKNKISKAKKGKSSPLKGIPKSEEHKLNMSISRKGFDSLNREIARQKAHDLLKIKIYAINIETGEKILFDSIEQCATKLELISSCISRVLRNDQNRKQHKGWKFELASVE